MIAHGIAVIMALLMLVTAGLPSKPSIERVGESERMTLGEFIDAQMEQAVNDANEAEQVFAVMCHPAEPADAALLEETADALRERLSSSIRFSGAQVETVPDGIRVTYADWPSRIGETAASLCALIEAEGHLVFLDPEGGVLLDETALDTVEIQWQDETLTRMGVAIKLNKAGTTALAEATSRLVGQHLSILLDGEVLMEPVIQSAVVGGQGIIVGDPYMTTGQSFDWASDIADRMRVKPLPVRLKAEFDKDIH